MPRTFIYVVDRDFGFAPNPFHGTCTLATCKPRIRSAAKAGDWVIGLGGRRLRATGKCIFAMQVERKITFQDYWSLPEFQIKKPARNGSSTRLVGDNIYTMVDGSWFQADSHHSNEDGTVNIKNLNKDTRTNSVLISSNFYYFGRCAITVPTNILRTMGYSNARNHRTFGDDRSADLLRWLSTHRSRYLHGEPFDFDIASERYTGSGSRITSTRR